MIQNFLVTSHGYILFSTNLLCCSALPFLIKSQLLHFCCDKFPLSGRNLSVVSVLTVVFVYGVTFSWGAGYFPSSYANCVSRIVKCLRFDYMVGFWSRYSQKNDEQYSKWIHLVSHLQKNQQQPYFNKIFQRCKSLYHVIQTWSKNTSRTTT